ncbi:glutathione-dependent formaldehyde-activating GFA [Gloeothece citriformis PCC 7424]|uniref:Glutathione-dependent formaldehyde-activating GFA n=1 Tax=Gloeothece citriformis (strain PCC 7424) TaxID=65393 RepID=B7K9W0_GLOC7|nr:GFA family protein [Gloeothece citriformis]ACK71316.1 glutathione-dependent formaldehyde-activating GFA [Gloeothece citriformis PCC 7424]
MSTSNIASCSCLCGAVSLGATNLNHQIAACHCNMCRKWGGGALLAVECASEVTFSGEENIEIYQSSEWAERGFCKKCGTHLFYRLKQNHQYYIPAGLFDSSEAFVLEHQIFIDEKPEYYSFANKTKNMTGAELFAQFSPSDQSQ